MPEVVNGAAHLRLDTLNPIVLDPVPGPQNPNPTGVVGNPSFYGTEIIVNQNFSLATGLAFEARVRLRKQGDGSIQKGLVGSVFSFFDHLSADGATVFDEIDYEFLSNDIDTALGIGGGHLLTTNVYDDDPPGPGKALDAQAVGVDLTEFNTFRVEWHPTQVAWYVNGNPTPIRVETDVVPDEAQTIRLNFWAPGMEWMRAYDPLLQPVTRRFNDTNNTLISRNQTFFYEVDYVQVERLNADDGLIFYDSPGAQTFSGGPGLDWVVYNLNAEDVLISHDSTGFTQVDSVTGIDLLQSIERLRFQDTSIAMDISGNAGQAFRLYGAAFDRVPDDKGLGFWIDALDKGSPLLKIAEGFVTSDEFRSLYGDNPSNLDIIQQLYQNILDRTGEAAGVDYWVNELNRGADLASVLVGFSESQENISSTLPFMQDGIFFQNWTG